MSTEEEKQDAFEEVASLGDGVDASATIPTDEAGHVPSGLVIQMGRPPSSHAKRGLLFTVDKAGERNAVLFAHQHKSALAIYSSSKEEIVFERGFPDGDQVGSANFHHWIVDQSKSILVRNAAGQQTDVRRKALGTHTHSFEANGKKFYWQRAGGESKASKALKPNLECVDDTGSTVAFYSQQRRWLCNGGWEKTVGELEIRKGGLQQDEVETMLMTLTVVWCKYTKRLMQASQAGNIGGLVTVLAYTIGG